MTTHPDTQPAPGPQDPPWSARLLGRFTVMKGAPRELWIIFAVHLVGYVSYMVMNMTLVLWLSYDLGYSDERASLWVFCWSALMTLITVFVGSLTDAIGVRKALLLSVYVCVVTRFIMTFATVKWVALGLGMLPVALGEALGTPAMVAATRRFSTTAQRTLSFSLFYASMNVGFFIAMLLFDSVRGRLGDRAGHFVLPGLGVELTTYRTLFLLSLVSQCALFPLLYFGLREGVEATDEGVTITPERSKYPNENFLRSLWLTLRDALRETARIFAGLWRQPNFHRFLGFLALAAFARLIFVHMNYTYPKFGIRELGAGAPVGKLYGINQILIIFLVPLVGAFSHRITAYRMVTVGSAIAAASIFIMALPPTWFQTLADGPLGHCVGRWYLGLTGSVNPWYVTIFFFIVFVSVGEALYYPRLYEYAACIAPKGQEGSYMSLSYLPFLLGKLGVASLSGKLLAAYCPEAGPRHSQMLWLIIALTTTICPVGLITLRRWIRVREAGRED